MIHPARAVETPATFIAMKPSIDFLALALLALTALIVIFLRLQSADDEEVVRMVEEEDAFYRQKAIDPASRELPVAGLSEEAFWKTGYLPADITRLLLPHANQSQDDAPAGLEAALRPGPKTSADSIARNLSWTATAFVVLLGLIFLLLWMLSFI